MFLIYKSPVTNLINYLEYNQCINDEKWNHKNCHPLHDLTQTCSGRKSVRLLWIQPTENFLTHPRTSFRIIERWSNKYDTHKSKNQQNMDWTKNLKDILDQEKQSIEANKSEYPTVTLVMTFHKPTGEANTYVWFGYSPQKKSNTPRDEFHNQ